MCIVEAQDVSLYAVGGRGRGVLSRSRTQRGTRVKKLCVRYWEKRQAGPTGAGTGRTGAKARERWRAGAATGQDWAWTGSAGSPWLLPACAARRPTSTYRCRRGTNAPPDRYLVRVGTYGGASGTRGYSSHGPHKSGALPVPEGTWGKCAWALAQGSARCSSGTSSARGGVSDCFFKVPSSLPGFTTLAPSLASWPSALDFITTACE